MNEVNPGKVRLYFSYKGFDSGFDCCWVVESFLKQTISLIGILCPSECTCRSRSLFLSLLFSSYFDSNYECTAKISSFWQVVTPSFLYLLRLRVRIPLMVSDDFVSKICSNTSYRINEILFRIKSWSLRIISWYNFLT